MATKKIDEKASEFERMLMWTSYRYCIGRHTYVVTMADDIAGTTTTALTMRKR